MIDNYDILLNVLAWNETAFGRAYDAGNMRDATRLARNIATLKQQMGID